MASIFDDAEAAATRHFKQLAKAGSRGLHPNNAPRDMRRVLLKGCKWPKPCLASVRVWNPRLQRPTLCTVAIMLPHELVEAMARKTSVGEMQVDRGMAAATAMHFDQIRQDTGLHALICTGLWCDATPCNWDRSKSVESICMSFPGHQSSLRLPIVGIMKDHCLKHHTHDDLMSIISWSYRVALTGKSPSCRHDGTPWAKSDLKAGRAKQAGSNMLSPIPIIHLISLIFAR